MADNNNDERFTLLCSGIIKLECSAGPCEGYVDVPCSLDFETYVHDQVQMPFKYQLLEARARYAPCCYWREESAAKASDPIKEPPPPSPETFSFGLYTIANPNELPTIEATFRRHRVLEDGTIEEYQEKEQAHYRSDELIVGGWEHKPSFYITPRTFEIKQLPGQSEEIDTKCHKLPLANQWAMGLDNRPPCNGAKSSCPFYSRGKDPFKYINDADFDPGKEIIGEMVQEVRSLMRNWKSLGDDAKKYWETMFALPYIWARDFTDVPTALPSKDDHGNVSGYYTKLNKIYWDFNTDDVKLLKLPSAVSDGTPAKESTDPKSAPRFPTMIAPIEGAPKPIEVTFPPSNKFLYESWEIDGNKLVFAGLSQCFSKVFVINSAFHSFNPDNLISSNVQIRKQEEKKLRELLRKLRASHSLPGFAQTTADDKRFWSVDTGVDLKIGLNKVVCLAYISGRWTHQTIEVNFQFYHYDLVQQGFDAAALLPGQLDHGNFILSAKTLGDDTEMIFNLVNLGSKPATPVKAYNFYVFDHSLGRMLGATNRPDIRYWGIKKKEVFVTGTGALKDPGKLRWYKFDNCQRFLVELLDPKPTTARPAGIDRSWEPTSIIFNNCVMKVVSRTGDGKLFPVRFMVVEPSDPENFTPPKDDQVQMKVQVEIYEAISKFDTEDAYIELLSKYQDKNIPSEVGGAPFLLVSDEMGFAESSHQVKLEENAVTITLPDGKGEVSYMVEFRSESGDTIGRKWIYGVGEIDKVFIRDVEINYIWTSEQTSSIILPNGDNRVPPKVSPIFRAEVPADVKPPSVVHYNTRCGDHEMQVVERHGPMWFPYDSCDKYSRTLVMDGSVMYYHILTYAKNPAERYRGPNAHQAFFVEFHGSCLIFCRFCNIWGNSVRQPPRWSGNARIRGPISEVFNPDVWGKYKFYMWELPPNGNRGREAYRSYKTMHYRDFIVPSPDGIKLYRGWLPTPTHIPSSSIFSEEQPRNFFSTAVERCIEPQSLSYLTVSGQQALKAIPEEVPAPTPEKELLDFKVRLPYEKVYKRHRYLNPDGSGVRFPGKEFGIEIKEDNIVWAFPEPAIPIARDESTQISGVLISKPDKRSDFYQRPILTEFTEGTYTLSMAAPKFEEGKQTEFACVSFADKYKVYFDHFSGEVVPYATVSGQEAAASGTEISGSKQFYGYDTPAEKIRHLFEEGEEPVFKAVYEDMSQLERTQFPTKFDDIDEFILDGDMIANRDIWVYPTDVDSVNEIVTWAAFVKSLRLDAVRPQAFPKSEVKYMPGTEPYADINAYTKFLPYPAYEPTERNNKSDLWLSSLAEGMFTAHELAWKPIASQDLTLDPKKARGYTGAVSVLTNFGTALEVLKIKLKYTFFADTYASIKEEPSFTIGGYDPLVDVNFVFYKSDTIIKKKGDDTYQIPHTVELDLSENPPYLSEFYFECAARAKGVGLKVESIELTVLSPFASSTEVKKEQILVLNSKFLCSYGRYTGNNDALSAHKFMSGILRAKDVSDFNEYAGVCEFWQPSLAETGLDAEQKKDMTSIGKTHHEHAGEFDSYDIRKANEDLDLTGTVFFDETVQLAEKRQTDLFTQYIAKLQRKDGLLSTHYSNYFPILDYERLCLLGQGNVNRSNYIYYTSDLAKEGAASGILVLPDIGFPKPWQDFGFVGCVGKNTTKTEGCGTSYEEPGICSTDGTALPANGLFDFEAAQQEFKDVLESNMFSERDKAGQANTGIILNDEKQEQLAKLNDFIKREFTS